MLTDAEPKSNELRDAELKRVEAETRRINAETAQLSRHYLWQHPGVLTAGLGALASISVLLTGVFSGYFDRRQRDLAEQRDVLQQEVDSLLSTKNTLERSEAEKVNANKAIEGILASGGSVVFAAKDDDEHQRFQIEFSRYSQIRRSQKQSRKLAEPLFPFEKLYTHGSIYLGDALLETSRSKDVTSELEHAVAALEVATIVLESDYYVVGEQCLERIRDSHVSEVRISGNGCTDAWIDALKGSTRLTAIYLSNTSVTPECISELIAACPALDTVSYHANSETLAGLASGVPHRTVRHLEVSCRGTVDLTHLMGFDRLISLHVASSLAGDAAWPEGFASHAKHIALPNLNGDQVSQLIGLRSVRVLSFGLASEDAAKGLVVALPRFTGLIELDVSCNYLPFPVSSLSNLTKLKNLSINHAKLVGSLAPIVQLESIENLILHGSPFDPAELEAIAQLPRLRVLDLSNLHGETMMTRLPRMEIANLQAFESATNLEEMRFDGNTLSPDAIASIARMKWLKALSLSTQGNVDTLQDMLSKLLDSTAVNVNAGPMVTLAE